MSSPRLRRRHVLVFFYALTLGLLLLPAQDKKAASEKLTKGPVIQNVQTDRATRTWVTGICRWRDTSSAINRASLSPWEPVQALAFPELATIACARPRFRWARQTLTGAAHTWLVVNIPAAVAGTSDTINAKSRFLPLSDPFPVPRRLISQNTPAARKPFGAVTDPDKTFNLFFMPGRSVWR